MKTLTAASSIAALAAASCTTSAAAATKRTTGSNVPADSEIIISPVGAMMISGGGTMVEKEKESSSSLFHADYATKMSCSIPRGGGRDDDDDNEETTSKKQPDASKKSSSKRKKSKTQESSSSSSNKKSSNPIVEEILKKDDYYQILGIERDASPKQILKAYRKRAVQTHPDKTGGDRRAFDKVAEANDTLSDENKRAIYDRYGKAGVENNANSGMAGGFGAAGGMPSSYQDMFRNMFQQQQQQQARRNRTMRYQLQVTLEDLYHGVTQNVMVTPPATMMAEQQGHHRQQKTVQVHIPKGSLSGQPIVLSGEMDFSSKDTPGDLIFVLTQAPHATFTRKGHDLAMELTISLEEAICGLCRPIRHLDGKTIWIQSAHAVKQQHHHDGDGDDAMDGHHHNHDIPIVIQTGDVQVLKGRGMPKKGQTGEYGDLYIQYRVEMPQTKKGAPTPLTREELDELRRLLSKLQQGGGTTSRKKKQTPPSKDTPIHTLKTASKTDFGRASGTVHLEEEENDEFGGGGFHPFGGSSSGFGFGSNGGFYFGRGFGGSNPFGGGSGPDETEEAECRTM